MNTPRGGHITAIKICVKYMELQQSTHFMVTCSEVHNLPAVPSHLHLLVARIPCIRYYISQLIKSQLEVTINSNQSRNQSYYIHSSFPICYTAEFSPFVINAEEGVPLEHLITCVQGVRVGISRDGFKTVCWSQTRTVPENESGQGEAT